MPSRSPVIKVQVNVGKQRRGFELTRAKALALENVSEQGRVSDSTAFKTARALTRQGLLRQAGPDWFITDLGKQVRARVRAKQRDGLHTW